MIKYILRIRGILRVRNLGISSFEDWPLDAMNPFSGRLNVDENLRMFPGWLTMMREPEKHFPPQVFSLEIFEE